MCCDAFATYKMNIPASEQWKAIVLLGLQGDRAAMFQQTDKVEMAQWERAQLEIWDHN